MRRASRGQAVPLVLGVGAVLLALVACLAAIGRAHVAKARAQAAADTAAISAARRLRDLLAERGGDPDAPRAWAGDVAAAAEPSARAAGGRVAAVRLPDAAAWPPAAVEVVVAVPGPLGLRMSATARAGVAPVVTGGAERVARATGGGWSGPLVFRDGKPMCPAVAAALDPMAAAARAQGVTLTVISGYRSDAEQAVLFARHPDPRWVAPPGRSRHRDATELDFAQGPGLAWLARNGARFGFVQRYSWEPWHWGHAAGCGPAGEGAPVAPVALTAALPTWVPMPYREVVAAAAREHGVPPALLAALLQTESAWRATAVSPAGALGIAQLMPATARGLGVADPFDPGQAIPAAARLLGGHLRAFGSAELALAAYNAGAGAVRRYGGVPPYRETQAYVVRVLSLAGGIAPGGWGGGGAEVRLLPVDGALV